MGDTKNQKHRERYIIAALIIAGIAFVLLSRPGLQYSGMKLYFPKRDSQTLAVERRAIAPIGSLEEKATEVVHELLLGPISRNMQPIVHSDIVLERVVSGNNAIFLDFSSEDIASFSPEYSAFKRAIDESLRATIPGSYRVYLYINSIPSR